VNLKPQDIVVAMKLVAADSNSWTYNQISFELGMSPSEVHSAVKRLLKVNLVRKKDGDKKMAISSQTLKIFRNFSSTGYSMLSRLTVVA